MHGVEANAWVGMHLYPVRHRSCSLAIRPGGIVVPINTRLSTPEIDNVLADASPRGLIRHSKLPASSMRVPLDLVADEGTLGWTERSMSRSTLRPRSNLDIDITSGTTGHPKGVLWTHANTLSNENNFNYWMRYQEGRSYLHAAPIFHIADFPTMFRGAGVWRTPYAV
jgi:acyl-CoA synthetase (AMP-forming)/AMP-acid ligase II